MDYNTDISTYDKEIWNLVKKENVRQEKHINLIASENYVSRSVMQAQGSQLTNKYAEGYPNQRYYGGCKYVDIIESLAIERAKLLFNTDYVNVQPHSGSQANFAVYTALLTPGNLILGMDLSHGGHLTHGSSVNLSGKLYNTIFYGLNKKEEIDYKQLKKLAILYKPKLIIGGFSSFSGICDWKYIRKIADSINAYFLADMSHIAGLVAANLYPSPVNYAHIVTSTTHKTLAGPRGGMILSNEKDLSLYKKLNSSVFPGGQGGPLVHVIAAKAIAFKEAMHSSFKLYQKQILNNAKIMVKIFLSNNYKIVSGGTYNHLFLIDLTNKNITGKDAEIALGLANITVNKNSIPDDTKNPLVTSGIRIGTPAITRRGFLENDVKMLSYWICDILNNIKDINLILKVKKNVIDLCKKYPVYKNF